MNTPKNINWQCQCFGCMTSIFLNPVTQFRAQIPTMNKEFLFLYDDAPLLHPYTAEQRKLRIAALHCIDVLHANGMNWLEAIASVCAILQQLRIA